VANPPLTVRILALGKLLLLSDAGTPPKICCGGGWLATAFAPVLVRFTPPPPDKVEVALMPDTRRVVEGTTPGFIGPP
jgi:hypothetical protein